MSKSLYDRGTETPQQMNSRDIQARAKEQEESEAWLERETVKITVFPELTGRYLISPVHEGSDQPPIELYKQPIIAWEARTFRDGFTSLTPVLLGLYTYSASEDAVLEKNGLIYGVEAGDGLTEKQWLAHLVDQHKASLIRRNKKAGL